MSKHPQDQEPTEKTSACHLPALAKVHVRAGLYLVSGPIGNLKDMTIRALETLAAVDGVLCEDTRVSGKLLSHYGLRKKLDIYNDHSDEKKRKAIVERIAAGEALALMSDAGTPLISDPGYKLVEEVKAAGLMVTSLPGANAPLTAIQLSGLPSDRFSFLGFLPPKSAARRSVLQEWQAVPSTLVAFETAPRLIKSLEDIAGVLGARRVAVTRELTKMFEEIRSGTAQELIAHYSAAGLPKGEIVLVIAPPEKQAAPQEGDLEVLLRAALAKMGTKDAAGYVSAQTGVPRKTLYKMALDLSKDLAR